MTFAPHTLRAAVSGLLVLGTVAGCGFTSDSAALEADVTLRLEGTARPAPGATVSVAAAVTGDLVVERFLWRVDGPDGASLATTEEGEQAARVRFKVSREGSHAVYCKGRLMGTQRDVYAQLTVLVEDPSLPRLRYTAQVLPPASTGLPAQDVLVEVGRVAQSNLRWVVSPGVVVKLKVTAGSAGEPTYLRMLGTGKDPLPRDLYLPAGTGSIVVGDLFHALFFPTSGSLAPLLVPSQDPKKMATDWNVQIPPGLVLRGTVRSGSARLPGATVSLSVVDTGVEVPSTLATTASDGSYTLWARKGTATLTVVPPASSGLPVAQVADAALQLLTDASDWSFTYDALTLATLGATVTGSDGKTVVSGATVVIRSLGSNEVGTLSAGGGKTLRGRGVVALALASNAAGQVVPVQGSGPIKLPQGSYTVDVWPGPNSPAGEGYSRSTLILTGGGSGQAQLALVPRAVLTGTVLDHQGQPVQARLQAVGSSGTFTSRSDAHGRFTLTLDDKLTYRLVVRAEPSSALASSYINPAQVVSGSGTLQVITLPRAVELSGKVLTSAGGAVAGALVRIWCSGSGCAGQDIVDEVRTGLDGTFSLRVPPAPGS